MTIQYSPGRLTALSPDGRTMGYVTFPQIRKGLVNIDRVQIFPAFRDSGVDSALLDALLIHLRQEGTNAALTSPQAQQYAAAHPQWREILPQSMHMTTH